MSSWLTPTLTIGVWKWQLLSDHVGAEMHICQTPKACVFSADTGAFKAWRAIRVLAIQFTDDSWEGLT